MEAVKQSSTDGLIAWWKIAWTNHANQSHATYPEVSFLQQKIELKPTMMIYYCLTAAQWNLRQFRRTPTPNKDRWSAIGAFCGAGFQQA